MAYYIILHSLAKNLLAYYIILHSLANFNSRFVRHFNSHNSKFLQNPPFQRWKVAETRQGRFRRYLRSYPQWPLPATFPGRRRTRGSSHFLSIPSGQADRLAGVLPCSP